MLGGPLPIKSEAELRHLIHIGYAKAGTHFVQRWFAAHPQIRLHRGPVLDRVSEATAVEESAVAWTVISSEEFASPRHAEPGTLPALQRDACRRLAARFPDAHILLLTRGFRSVLVSGYSQYVKEGGSNDFYAFRPVEPRDLQYAVHAWDYGYLMQLYGEAFGGRVTALPYELLRDDPARFVCELEQRLLIRPGAAQLSRINPALSGTELRWYPRFARALARLPVGARGTERLRRWHARGLRTRPWRFSAAALQRLFPAVPVSEALVGEREMNFFRGRADVFRDHPLYRPYHADYLIEG